MERNANYKLKRKTDPKALLCDGADQHVDCGEHHREVSSDSEPQELSHLVWKYFEKEIHETLIEVQEAIESEQSKPTAQVSQ